MRKVWVKLTTFSSSTCNSIYPTATDSVGNPSKYLLSDNTNKMTNTFKFQNHGCTLLLDLDPTHIVTPETDAEEMECKFRLLESGDKYNRTEYKLVLKTKSEKIVHESTLIGVNRTFVNENNLRNGTKEYQIDLPNNYLNKVLTLSIHCETQTVDFEEKLTATSCEATQTLQQQNISLTELGGVANDMLLYFRQLLANQTPTAVTPQPQWPNSPFVINNNNNNHRMEYNPHLLSESDDQLPPRKKQRLSNGANYHSLPFSMDFWEGEEAGQRILSPALGNQSDTLISSRENLCKLDDSSDNDVEEEEIFACLNIDNNN